MEEQMTSFKSFLIVVGIIALITAAVFIIPKIYTPTSKNRLVYNNFEFKKASDGFWQTKWQSEGQVYDLTFRYNPKEIETVPIRGQLNNTFNKEPHYITFDPEQQNSSDYKYLALGVAELGLNLARGMGQAIESACTTNATDACIEHPIITCDDDDKSVYYLKIAPEPRIRLEGNCLIIEGSEFDLIKAVDRVLYHFYRIIPA